jgi:hypothetical protein
MTRTAVVAGILVVIAGLGCGAKPDEPRTPLDAPSSPYRGTIKAADGHAGVPCAVEISMSVRPNEWLPINSVKTTTGGTFEGSVGAITSAAVEMPVRVSVKCDGYAPLSREVKWNISPTQSQTFDLGDVVVARR